MRNILLITLLLIPIAGYAAEFKPYPTADITIDEWKQYHDQIVNEHNDTKQEFPEQNLIVYFNNTNATSYAFTTEGHPAHPAWVTRQVVEKNGSVNINQIGYFSGSEPEFAELFKQYLDLNEKIKNDIANQNNRQ